MAQANIPLSPWDSNKKHSDRERWICIYPAYVNRKKTRQEGRKIPKEDCVDNPSYLEIKDVLATKNFNILIENKLYPRERSKEITHRGRIRVQLRNDDGSPVNPEFKTREDIFVYVGKMIPQLKSRQNKTATDQQPSTSSSGQQPAGKKGKGKRR